MLLLLLEDARRGKTGLREYLIVVTDFNCLWLDRKLVVTTIDGD